MAIIFKNGKGPQSQQQPHQVGTFEPPLPLPIKVIHPTPKAAPVATVKIEVDATEAKLALATMHDMVSAEVAKAIDKATLAALSIKPILQYKPLPPTSHPPLVYEPADPGIKIHLDTEADVAPLLAQECFGVLVCVHSAQFETKLPKSLFKGVDTPEELQFMIMKALKPYSDALAEDIAKKVFDSYAGYSKEAEL